MYFYQLVFNRPLSLHREQANSFTYGSALQIENGTRVSAEFGQSVLVAVVVSRTSDLNEVYKMQERGVVIKEIIKIIDSYPILHEDQIDLAQWMSSYYLASWGECVFTILPSAKREKETDFSEEALSHFDAEAPQLSLEQEQCSRQITEFIDDDKVELCYLYGITGSGKTEVFLAGISHAISKGTQSIYLVPEIALVLQCYPLLCARFGAENIAVLHSKLTASQKLKEWNRIKSGEAKIVLGVRSAVFAPVKNLGLLVIDEEHDGSYKSGHSPRYHTRQIAFKRCQTHKALLAMGSATPSLEAWINKGKANFKFMTLHNRVAGGKPPKIELVSLEHTTGCISVPLQEEIITTLAEDKQVLLLLNRRGFSHAYLCNLCGHVVQCPHCSVNLTYHRVRRSLGVASIRGEFTTSKETSEGAQNMSSVLFPLGQKEDVGKKTVSSAQTVPTQNQAQDSQAQDKQAQWLECHHCGYSCSLPSTCPSCNYVSMALKGWGTQRVEQEVKRLFPKAAVARIDSDIIKVKNGAEDILRKFYKRETQIMVGTQLLAKGINLPYLKLVAILFADSLLGIPDFRAEERAHALMTQVIGRSGRFFDDGKVIIQGYGIENKIFANIQAGNPEHFYAEELAKRQKFNLAPYHRLLRLVFRGKDEDNTKHIAELFANDAQTYIAKNSFPCQILGPASCAIEKISDNYRYHVLLSAKSQIMLNKICRDVLVQGVKSKANSKKVYLEIDPDPVDIF